MSIKTRFSIKDLENLTSVKAHTIRIWEKRYNLLEPDRTDTNIRQYDLDALKKILNISLLYNEGYKISKLAKKTEDELNELILSRNKNNAKAYILNAFKTAMLDFDSRAFENTYNLLREKHDFRSIFFNYLIPLLGEIGTIWQAGIIDPSHERFVSELIKQKIIINTHNVQQRGQSIQDPIFVLYLPYEEIHEIGLLYANYEILAAGFSTIYLGINIPIESLKYVIRTHQNIHFLSYFTVKPDEQSLQDYCLEFNDNLSSNSYRPFELWLMGAKTIGVKEEQLEKNCKLIGDLPSLIDKLKTLKKS